MTSYYDVTCSVYPVTMTIIGRCSILEFGKGSSNQAVAPGISRPLHVTELGVRNPFILPVEKVPDSFQDEFLKLKIDTCAGDLFNEKSITKFWPLMCDSYPKVAKKAIQGILPFVSTYLCESGFSTLLQMKTIQRNRLDVENDMRCATPVTSLGHQEGRRVFRERPNFLCPTYFPGEVKIF